jgi:hypothetical protein
MVILTAETAALENSLDRHTPRIAVLCSYNILLSGKKARVYVASKKDIPAAPKMC